MASYGMVCPQEGADLGCRLRELAIPRGSSLGGEWSRGNTHVGSGDPEVVPRALAAISPAPRPTVGGDWRDTGWQTRRPAWLVAAAGAERSNFHGTDQ